MKRFTLKFIIIEAAAYVALLVLVLLAAAGGAGCRVASFEERRPDGTVIRGFGGSTFTTPKGGIDIERTATTQRTKLEYESKSNAAEAIELLRAVK